MKSVGEGSDVLVSGSSFFTKFGRQPSRSSSAFTRLVSLASSCSFEVRFGIVEKELAKMATKS